MAGEAMADNNGSGKAEQAKFDGVVDELRNVISGLGNTLPVTGPAPASAPLEDPFSEQDHRAPRVEKTIPKPNGNGRGATASDADFWNGNVLGWPSNSDADLPEVPVIAKPSTEPVPGDGGFFREDSPDTSFDSMPAPVESDFDRLSGANEPTAFTPPVPEPIENTPEAWPLLKDAEDVIPAPPLAPSSTPVAPSQAVRTPAPSADPWMQSGSGLDVPPPEPVASTPPPVRAPEFVIEPHETKQMDPIEVAPTPAAAPDMRPAADFEFELPIPGTKEKKEAPVVESGGHLDLAGTELKPRDLIQVACIYPEGQEKAGQAFVTKLREAAEKLRAPMTIQAVFVSSWSPDKLEPQAWAKSASLSGADAMFVLSFRASGKLFSNLGETTAKCGTKARLVLLEQTAFPTLYADILVELRRTR
jgi:hypothetical protein